MADAGGTDGLSNAQQRLGAAERRLATAETELQEAPESDPVDEQRVAKAERAVSRAELGVAKAELGVAKAELKAAPADEKANAELGVAKAELGVAEAKWQAARQEDKVQLWTLVESAQAALEAIRTPAPQPSSMGHHEYLTQQEALLERFAEQQRELSQMISKMKLQSRHITFLPSSAHDSQYNTTVLQFYGNGRRCCLTGFEDPGQGGGLPTHDRVVAAHIIPTAAPDLLLQINSAHVTKEFLNFSSPKDAILMQKKWEVLFDRHCWCLFPDKGLESAPNFRVHVFATTDAAQLSFIASSSGRTLDEITEWVTKLQDYKDSVVRFDEGRAPSFRALSAHGMITVETALAMRWIDSDTASKYAIFAELSPSHSPPG